MRWNYKINFVVTAVRCCQTLMSSSRGRSYPRPQILGGRTVSTQECLSSHHPMKLMRSCSRFVLKMAALMVRTRQTWLFVSPHILVKWLQSWHCVSLQVETKASSTATSALGLQQTFPNTFHSSITSAVLPSTRICQHLNSQYSVLNTMLDSHNASRVSFDIGI